MERVRAAQEAARLEALAEGLDSDSVVGERMVQEEKAQGSPVAKPAKEFRKMHRAKSLNGVIDSANALLAEHDGRTVGIVMLLVTEDETLAAYDFRRTLLDEALMLDAVEDFRAELLDQAAKSRFER